jgi:hypothetical protein
MRLELMDKIHWSELEPGTRVHYKKCAECKEENGIVKRIKNLDGVYVVYNCFDDWANYQNYTAALTPIRDLKLGWV